MLNINYFDIKTGIELWFIQLICYSASDISYSSKSQCLHFLGVCIVFLCFIFKIGTGTDNAWYQCTLSVPEIDPFRYGVHDCMIIKNGFSDS